MQMIASNVAISHFPGTVVSFYSGIYNSSIGFTKSLGIDRKKYSGESAILLGNLANLVFALVCWIVHLFLRSRRNRRGFDFHRIVDQISISRILQSANCFLQLLDTSVLLRSFVFESSCKCIDTWDRRWGYHSHQVSGIAEDRKFMEN